MKIFSERPALAVACLAVLFGMWNVAMSWIYHTPPDIEAIRPCLAIVVGAVIVDAISQILKGMNGG